VPAATPHRNELAEATADFLREACPLDKLHRAFDGDQPIADAIWDGMMQLGLGGVAIPEAYGGLGLSLAEVAEIGERIGWAAAPGPWIAHVLAGLAIDRAGDERQKARWLPRLASGEATATLALCEGALWKAEDWRLSPRDGVLTGTKDYVPGAQAAQVAVVGLAGGRLGLVELQAPQASCLALAATDRTRPAAQVSFDRAPVELLAGAFGPGLLDAAAVLLAADAHGGSVRMVEDAVAYSKTRVQFGQVIAQFQAVKHKMADLALAIHHNGALYRRAAERVEAGAEDGPLCAAVTKALATDTFSQVARLATESYGGIGYTWEHSAHIWLRRAMFDYAWLGAPDAHRTRALDLLGW